MTTQLLIYGDVQPITRQRHQDWSVKAGDNYRFAQGVNSVPLMAVEFHNAAKDCAIVFAGEGDVIMPVVVMGMRDKENLYVSDSGEWESKYIPAFIRRYPFVFSTSDDGVTLTLCIDENFDGCNEEGKGERMFDADGEQTQYLNNVLEFLKEYQAHFLRTKQFCKRLVELDLLEPMGAEFNIPGGEKRTLSGFQAVSRKRLKELSSEQLAELMESDELELIYVHMQSMSNMAEMLPRASTAKPADPDSTVPSSSSTH
jgi:hypothetical protein